jgi:hypothetical protein
LTKIFAALRVPLSCDRATPAARRGGIAAKVAQAKDTAARSNATAATPQLLAIAAFPAAGRRQFVRFFVRRPRLGLGTKELH